MIGTHNSMTYLPPKKWYLYPLRFMARCQSKSIQEQYEKYGARIFDIRISFTKEGKAEFRHGLMAFKGVVNKVFEYLNSKKDCYVRISLEKPKNVLDNQEVDFKRYCAYLENAYPNIYLFGGKVKYDWHKVYTFKNEDISSKQLVSSTTWKILDDWCPWFYARFMNKKNRANYKSNLEVDFIQY